MPRKKKGDRVVGDAPYHENGNYYYVLWEGGERYRIPCKTRDPVVAQAHFDHAKKLVVANDPSVTVAHAWDRYELSLQARDIQADSLASYRTMAARFLNLFHRIPVSTLRARHTMMYLDVLLDSTIAMATKKGCWEMTLRVIDHWRAIGLLQRDLRQETADAIECSDLRALPWSHKTKANRNAVNRRKPILRGEEPRTYALTALTHPDPVVRVAAALPLLTGIRSGELRHLTAPDVDFVHRVIWIQGDKPPCRCHPKPPHWTPKSEDSWRELHMPSLLVPALKNLVQRHPNGFLMPHNQRTKFRHSAIKQAIYRMLLRNGPMLRPDIVRATTAEMQTTRDCVYPMLRGMRKAGIVTFEGPEQKTLVSPTDTPPPSPETGEPHDRTWLGRLVARTCAHADVARVCPHGLRNTYATLKSLDGLSDHELALEMGHGTNVTTTRRHYIHESAPDAVLELKEEQPLPGRRIDNRFAMLELD